VRFSATISYGRTTGFSVALGVFAATQFCLGLIAFPLLRFEVSGPLGSGLSEPGCHEL
jgi:threonine/homoserine/homoserine lactone efflux protein